MFGDKLLPSECSLIVEELKRTSLCFQVCFKTLVSFLLMNAEFVMTVCFVHSVLMEDPQLCLW